MDGQMDQNASAMNASGMASGMNPWFVVSNDVTLLVKGWETKNTSLYIASLVAVFVSGFLYEALALLQLWVHQRLNAKVLTVHVGQAEKTSRLTQFGDRSLLALAYGVKVGVGYLLMLAVMSFNLGVYVAVVLGMTVGFFLLRSSDLYTDA